MARITWELQQGADRVGWIGKVGERTAFIAEPDGVEAWELRFTWTGGTFGPLATITTARELAEMKLVLFAEQTGITLPEDSQDDELTLRQLLHERVFAALYQKNRSREELAKDLTTEALDVFRDKVRDFIEQHEDRFDDIEYRGAADLLDKLLNELSTALDEED